MGSLVGNIIGGVAGGMAEGAGLQNNFQSPLSPDQQRTLAQALMQQQAMQSGLAGQLQQQAAGQGPNLGQLQLEQATNRNIQQATGMLGSQKGINTGLAARQAARGATAANQQAAGQSGLMRAQQQLESQKLLAGQGQGLMQQTNQAMLGSAGIGADVAKQNLAMKGQLTGGLMNAIGGGLALKYMSEGGKVSGKAEVSGDSPANDTVPAMLSPGEIVVPRTKSGDADSAKEFIDHLMKSEGKPKSKSMSYGELLSKKREIQSQLSEIDKRLKGSGE